MEEYFDDFARKVIEDMKAFEDKYPNAHLIFEMIEVSDQDKWRLELDGQELVFDTYQEAIDYLNIYD
jgi:hypothetical protein